MSSLDELNRRFAIPGAVTIDAGPGGLPRVNIKAPLAEAQIYLHGAHVTHFQARGQKPLLFLSSKSHFEANKPIRGGVPICFPWFGPRSGDSTAPIHGFARLLSWELAETKQLPDGSVNVALELRSSDATKATWPFDFVARYQVNAGKALELTLRVTNESKQPFTFEEALHTYLAVSDVRKISVDGLTNTRYIDKVDGAEQKTQTGAITIEGETDRVYLDTTGTTTVADPTWSRQIHIKKSGSNATVVWNPWIAKAKAMADFGDDEWPRMLCVETANAASNAITLASGATHEMRAVIEATG
jgi:glucose-6-phosphate 1-epimerase